MFDKAADLYEHARPNYPVGLFDDLASLSRLPEHAQILEIGCGTGKATLPLADLGFQIVCVELGEQLAAVARRRLAAFPNVEIINADFESWEAGNSRFDAVVAFTAFHWIDPDLRYEKAARLLRQDGALAVVTTKHVLPDNGDQFFAEVQEEYDVIIPGDHCGPPIQRPDKVVDLSGEIEASGHLVNVGERRYLWDVTYTADEYIALLDTFADHRTLDEATRKHLYERIHRRIEARPERRVRKTYLAILNVARRQ
jgi:SAM-dependent methyltransferase